MTKEKSFITSTPEQNILLSFEVQVREAIVIKIFSLDKHARVFVLYRPFQPSLRLVDEEPTLDPML